MQRFERFVVCFLLIFSNSVLVAQQLSGTYTIGATGDYETFNSAVGNLNELGVSGPVVFDVLDGTYNERIYLINIPGASPVNTITFQSQASDPNSVELTFSATSASQNYVVFLDQTNYVTFRQITLTAGGTNFGHVFDLENAANITIQDCVINGVTTNSVASEAWEVIHVTGSNSQNLLITGNIIRNGDSGIETPSGRVRPTNNRIINNSFVNQYFRAVRLNSQDAPLLQNNRVTTNSQTSAYIAFEISNWQNNLRVTNNEIIAENGSGILVADGLGTDANPGLVSNNFIKVGTGDSTTAIGIQIYNNSFLNIYHNSVYVNSSYSIWTRALWMYLVLQQAKGVRQLGPVNIVNNIFASPGSGYPYYIEDVNSIASSQYNAFDATDSNNFIYWEQTHYTTLQQLQNATESNGGSIAKSIFFANAAGGDLHLSGTSSGDVALAGQPLSSVGSDIDGDTRDPLYPYMGADEAPIALPVELAQFTAALDVNAVVLSWITATETDNFGFDIERSTDSKRWQFVALIPGGGTTAEPRVYEFKDTDAKPGVNYYRLRQIDNSGDFEYSQIVEINIPAPGDFRLEQNYPNPFNPNTSIHFSLPRTGYVELNIVNIRGELVRQLAGESMPQGAYTIAWDGRDQTGNDVVSGAYFYVLRFDGNAVDTRKMLLLR